MRKKLLFQIGALIAAFLLVVLIVLGTLIYVGSTSLFLNAKNEMIDRDMFHVRDQLLEIPVLSEMFDHWRQDPEMVLSSYTNEELNEGYNFLEGIQGEISDEEFEKAREIYGI